MATLGLGLVALLWPYGSFRLANKNSKAKRVPPSMNGDEYTLGLLEEDIVVHESWWCCGAQIAVAEDMVVKLGPLVAVVVVEAAAAASAATAAALAAAAAAAAAIRAAAASAAAAAGPAAAGLAVLLPCPACLPGLPWLPDCLLHG